MAIYNTLQDVFNAAYTGLAAQGFERSGVEHGLDDHFECRYRGEGGTKCAIGHCIPDDKYLVAMENKTPFTLFREHGEIMEGIFGDEANDNQWFLVDLQDAHDDAISPEDMKNRLHRLAADNKLSVPEIDNA